MKRVIVFTCLVGLYIPQSSAQFEQFENLEEVGSKGFWADYFKGFFDIKKYTNFNSETPISLNSDLSFETRSYNTTQDAPQQSPFYWVLNANTNLNVYGFDIPVQVFLSQEERQFTKPQPPPLPGVPSLPDLSESVRNCLLYTSPSPRDQRGSRMPSSA